MIRKSIPLVTGYLMSDKRAHFHKKNSVIPTVVLTKERCGCIIKFQNVPDHPNYPVHFSLLLLYYPCNIFLIIVLGVISLKSYKEIPQKRGHKVTVVSWESWES